MCSFVKFLSIILIFTIYLNFSESLECLKCSSKNDTCTTLIGKETFETCKTENDNFKCYTKQVGYRNERGCETEKEKCPDNNETCKPCNEKDKCNDIVLPEDRFKCIQCNGTECAEEQNPNAVVPCLDESKECYTYHDDVKVIRGCVNSKDQTCDPKDKEKCDICENDSCNTVKVELPFTCYRCRSDIHGQENCAYENVKGIKPSKCIKEWGKDEKKKCSIERSNNVIYRACVVDLLGDSIKNCNNTQYTNCITCDKPNCNNGKAPNVAGIIQTSISMIFIILTTLIFILN